MARRRRGSQCRYGGSVAQFVSVWLWSAGRGERKNPRCRTAYFGEDPCFYSAPLKQPLTKSRLLTRKRSRIHPAFVALAPVQTRPGPERRPERGRAMAVAVGGGHWQPRAKREGGGGRKREGGAAEDEAVVLEEDLSDEEADSAGPVKWVVPACEVLAADRGGWRAGLKRLKVNES
jgi:hypothetical protein